MQDLPKRTRALCRDARRAPPGPNPLRLPLVQACVSTLMDAAVTHRTRDAEPTSRTCRWQIAHTDSPGLVWSDGRGRGGPGSGVYSPCQARQTGGPGGSCEFM